MSQTKQMSFQGFDPGVKGFFEQLRENNSKDWFDRHRDYYEKSIKEPCKLLVQAMAVEFADAGLPFVADTKKSIFRINRDIRFSNNKDPYKTNMGLFFPYSIAFTGLKPVQALGLYFHIDYQETFVAAGVHCPETPMLNMLRRRVAEQWEELIKIANAKPFNKEFPSRFVGESLKTVPRGFAKDHPAADLLRLKEYTVYSTLGFEETYSDGLVDIILRKGKTVVPFLEFFQKGLE